MKRAGQIVLTPFPYTDLSGAKLRPVLMLRQASRFDDRLVCMVSSKTDQAEDGFDEVLTAHSQSSEPVNLTTEEVISLVKEKSISTQNTRWGSVNLQFKEDGTLYGNNNGGSDSGKWRVVEGKLCLEWRRWDYEGCGVVRRVGNEIQHLWPNGGVHFTYRP